VPCDAAPGHLEAGQFFADASFPDGGQRRLSGKILVPVHQPGVGNLQRAGLPGNILAVEHHAGFQAQRVARSQSGRFHALFDACVHQAVPDGPDFVGGGVNFEAVLAGVAAAGNDGRNTRHLRGDKPIKTKGFQIVRRQGLQNCFRERPLQIQFAGPVAYIGQRGVKLFFFQDGSDPLKIGFTRSGVGHQHIKIPVHLVNSQVVNDAAPVIEQGGEFDLTGFLPRQVARQGKLKQIQRLRPFHFDFSHVADVKHGSPGAGCAVFFDDACVLHRHGPAAEIDHFGVSGGMTVVQRRFFHEKRSFVESAAI